MRYRDLELDPFQETAISHLRGGRSVLVAAPTGTGKTVIADWIVDQAFEQNRRVIYTAPIKALSNQKYRDWCRLHGEERVGLVTGDLVIRRNAPCLVMTTEILRNMLLAGEPVDDLLAVVIDEIHFLDDRERGTVWEEVLIYLPQHVLIVALSATLPNLGVFSEWMTHVRQRPVEVVSEARRAVPLDYWFATRSEGIVTTEKFEAVVKQAAHAAPMAPPRRHGRDRHGPPGGRGARGGGQRGGDDRNAAPRTTQLDVVRMIERRDWLPMLYFVFSRRDAERFAVSTSARLRIDLVTPEEAAEIDVRLDAIAPLVGLSLDRELREMYRRGVAYHHAGLHVMLKSFVEELYEARLTKVLFCTSTFALGINMPARCVAFHGLMKFDGQDVKPLSTRGFMQKAGRAGRRGMDEHGHVVLRMDPDEYPDLKPVIGRYLKQIYEPVQSSFNLSFNSIVNLLGRHGIDAIRTIVDRSFLSWNLMQEAKRQLERAQLLEQGSEGRPPKPGDLKEARRLRNQAERFGSRCWDAFMQRRDFLQRIHYLGANDEFLAGAKVLQHIQIAEILVTELVLSGELEALDASTLFGVLCAVSGDLPRGATATFIPSRKDRELVQRLQQVRLRNAVTEAERLTNLPATWSPEMLVLGRSWAEGDSLADVLGLIQSTTDVSGTLISGFRRAKDLAGQLKAAYAEVPDKVELLGRLIRAVSRDEVEVVD